MAREPSPLDPELAVLIRAVAAHLEAVFVKLDQTILHPDYLAKWQSLGRPKPKPKPTAPAARPVAPEKAA